MRKQILLLWCLGLCVSVAAVEPRVAHGQAKNVHRCKGQQAFKYKVEIGVRTIVEPVKLVLLVGVKPEQINRTDMTLLAKQLSQDFCREHGLYVAIYDDPRALKQWYWLYYYARTEGKSEKGPLRGIYELDRKTGAEKITFSTRRNNPLDEVVIVLSGRQGAESYREEQRRDSGAAESSVKR
jgi:hypothetical protein